MKKRFNQRDLDVLGILLHSDEPLSSSQIAAVREDLSQQTVVSVLRKLLDSGYVEVSGVTYIGNVLSRTYKVTDLGKEEIVRFFAKLYVPFADTLGILCLVTEILNSLDEEQRNTEISKLKEMFKS